MLKSIKDYCNDKGLSYETVRRQVQRYKDDLEGHVSIQNKTRYLDEYAQDFLDQHRLIQPIIVKEQTDEIEDLRKQLEELQIQKDALMKQLLDQQKQITEMVGAEARLESAEARVEILLEDKNSLSDQVESLQEANKNLEIKNALSEDGKKRAEAEVDRVKASYKKTIFGLYKKVDE